MAVSPGPKLVLVLLLSCGLLNSSPLDLCPEFCTCQTFLHLNCSAAGLSAAPLKINPSITELDFSNNQLGSLTFQSKYYNLQKVWLGNNSMSHLSLCVDVDLKGQSKSRSRLRGRWGCLLWAPALQLLSVERNQLQTFPEGLGQQRSLQILHLSFNKISMLEQRDFSHLKQLEELHLQHNLISRLHPQIFEKLNKLKVIDLSFNTLTTLHPVTYISLHHIGADVALRGNSWICDCAMRFLQRGTASDNSKGLKTLSIECASPLALSGRNLQEFNEEDLECQDSHIHHDVTVHRGSETLLRCSEPDAAWWTPNGETRRPQEQGGLFITDVTERDEGLYVCLSKSHQILSLYHLQILEQSRSIRSVSDEVIPRVSDKMVQTRITVTQSHFAMAVSLSVIITFIIAFILGVLLQPYICVCWQKIKTKKQKPVTPPVPNAQQEEYDNDAYLHCEDVDDFEPYRERRVTFTEYTEEGDMQYYDTVAGDAQEDNGAVIGPGQAQSSDDGSEAGLHNHRSANHLGKKIEFEIIPDSNVRNSFSSQSSKSSIGDKIVQDNRSKPNTTQQAFEEQIQKTTIDVPHISLERPNEIPGFVSEPFADWLPHGNDISIVDPDLDNGEPFEYSDSVRSGSPLSPNSSFKQPTLNVPNIDKTISLSSSSSSDVSDSEPTHYTVNPESEEEPDVFGKRDSTKSSSSSIESATERQRAVDTWPVVDLEHIPTVKRRLIFQSVFVDSYNKDTAMKNQLQQEQPLEQKSSSIKKRKAPLPPPRKPSCSSSDSDGGSGQFKQEKKQLETKPDLKVVHFEQESPWPVVNLEHVSKVERRLEFKEQYAASESFSGSDGQEERIYEEIKEQIPIYSKQVSPTATSEVKQMSGTSSSSESEENYYENIQLVTSQKKPQDSQWPVIDLVKIPKVKRRLDVKTAVATIEEEQVYANVQGKVPTGGVNVPSSSSSSESEDEQGIKVNQEILQQATSPVKPPPAVKPDLQSQWPVIDLLRVPTVKRRLDITQRLYVGPERLPSNTSGVLKPHSGTSSSSESDEEQEIQIKQHQEKIQTVTSSNIQPTETQWPVINLVKIPKVKRRLDIKERERVKVIQVTERVPSAILSESDTSFSSESEDEQVKVNQTNVQETTSPVTRPTAVKPNQESQWPVVNLLTVHQVKRRLDIKTISAVQLSSSSVSGDAGVKVIQTQGRVPSTPVSVQKPQFDSSSSSESEDEQINKATKEHLQQIVPSNKQPTDQHISKWPIINLITIPKVKRRLDIKERVSVRAVQVQERVPSASIRIPKQDSVTSSSSESEEDINHHYENIHQLTSSAKQLEPDSQWPVINLVNLPKLKQRLDVKPTIPDGNVSSSSSDSEDEHEITGIKQENVLVSSQFKQPIKSQWPVVDFVKIPKVKRRLDIKERVSVRAVQVQEKVPSASIRIPKQDSVTSSSSESEEDINHHYENIHQLTSSAKQLEPDSQWPVINLVNLPKLKQRLDVKPRHESEDEETIKVKVSQENLQQIVTSTKTTGPETDASSSEKVGVTILGSKVEAQTQWPVVDVGGITQLKRRLDFKIPSQPSPLPVPASGGSSHTLVRSSSSSSDQAEDEKVVKSLQMSAGQTTSQTSLGLPRISRRLDIKGPAMKPEDSDSSSSSDDEKNNNLKLSSGSLKYQDNTHFIKVSPLSTLPHSPTKTAPSIQLEKYMVTTDDASDKAASGTTSPVVTPDLQSKWAAMNLGRSRFRKRLDITRTSNPPPVPSHPPPSPPKTERLIGGIGAVTVTEQVSRAQTADDSSSSEREDDSKLDPVSPQANLTSILHVKRSLHFTTKQKRPSLSSSGDDDAAGVRVPDISRGIPRIKRRLNITAPTPPPSSSSSDDEKLYAHRFSDVTDQRSIEYKRTIMKTHSNDSFTRHRETYRQPLHVESSPQTPKKLSLDNIKRKLMPSKQIELPPNLRWTSVGSHLSEHPVPIRQHGSFTLSPPMSSPPTISKDRSSDSSSSEDEQKEVKTTSVVTQKTYNPRSVTFNTSPTILTAATFEEKTERRGLSALKAMSSDRKYWDSQYETVTESVPISVDFTPEQHTVYRRTVDVKTKMSQPLTYSSVSPTLDERRREDMLYGIPSYKRHTVKSIELSQGPPPPVPSTPLPEESIDFTWRSPQTSLSRGSFVQEKTAEEESVDEPFYDNPNISAV
ncbi:uncharacterized protein lrrc66 [Eucyclogobius newberryi]|uniref:uncharacterized protein lrrc66 n=1 Tax=Eucyclogobius newberryi TaxID=166745 RepID=UPI003B59DF74